MYDVLLKAAGAHHRDVGSRAFVRMVVDDVVDHQRVAFPWANDDARAQYAAALEAERQGPSRFRAPQDDDGELLARADALDEWDN